MNIDPASTLRVKLIDFSQHTGIYVAEIEGKGRFVLTLSKVGKAVRENLRQIWDSDVRVFDCSGRIDEGNDEILINNPSCIISA